MKKRKATKKYNQRKCIIDESLMRLADDLVSSILKACWTDPKGGMNLREPTHHMRQAIFNYEDYKRELLYEHYSA